jgi:signal peptidase II
MFKWVLLFAFLFGLDIATKVMAMYWIPYFNHGSYPFGGFGIFSAGGVTFSLNYVVNTGAAWGFFSGYSGLLFLLRMAIILSLVIFVPKRIPIWLVLTGALGNALDYCLYGHVIDFLHFTFWGYSFPIFNIADSCIFLGVLMLILTPQKSKEAKI